MANRTRLPATRTLYYCFAHSEATESFELIYFQRHPSNNFDLLTLSCIIKLAVNETGSFPHNALVTFYDVGKTAICTDRLETKTQNKKLQRNYFLFSCAYFIFYLNLSGSSDSIDDLVLFY